MGERSYLAIGDVLALLREEFPDVTISKIRFLESRGLLDPERTPSGYRKFYEPDVDRLRWILRQQREHFLPLKVIKGRLENGMTDAETPTPHLFEMGDPPPVPNGEPVLVGARDAAAELHERTQAGLAALAQLAAVGASQDRASGRSGHAPVSNREHDESLVEGSEAGPPGRGLRSSAESRRPTTVKALGDEPAEAQHSPPSRRRRLQGQVVDVEVVEIAVAAEGVSPAVTAGPVANDDQKPEQVQAPAPARAVSTRSTAGLPGAGLSGASLTVAELANASGLEPEAVQELESFGLIAGRTVAGVHCYSEEAVIVAKLAARFAPYGIEARHLKVFKHAADRQTGLYAQVVTPLLRQRNPDARARAIADLGELAELGEALMRCFTQATLRELTGG